MDQKEALGFIVGAIKNKKKKVIDFIQSKGGSIKNSDSDIKIGKDLVLILKSNPSAIKDFAASIEGDSLFGIDDAISGITGLISGGQAKATSAQQGSDAITLALINAGIQKQSATNWPLILGIIAGVIVFIVIGILVYKKYNK